MRQLLRLSIKILLTLGYTDEQWSQYIAQKKLLAIWSSKELPQQCKQKEFIKTNGNLPTLDSYEGELPEGYWENWEKKSYNDLQPIKSWISPDKLMEVATNLGYIGEEPGLQLAVERLIKGADIGCKGDGRLPTSQKNSTSATKYGVRVADSLQTWIREGLCFGPLTVDEMPWKEFTTSPITVKLKPNGKARICINLSAPHRKDSDPVGTPSSVNSGIDSQDFSTSMSMTPSIC